MILKERKYKKCPTCKSSGKIIQWEEYGCDNCNKIIGSENDDRVDYLRLGIWYEENNPPKQKELHLCSWKCVFVILKKEWKKVGYFINLPMLSAGNKTPGTRIKDFMELVDKK